MKKIKGYVIVRKTTGRRYMFGPSTAEHGAKFQNIETNGLAPFLSKAEARTALETIEKNREEYVLAVLRLNVAETEADLGALRQTPVKAYVVIYGRDEQVRMLGELQFGLTVMFDCGAAWSESAEPFSDFASAERLASEASRQSREPATLAMFNLQFV